MVLSVKTHARFKVLLPHHRKADYPAKVLPSNRLPIPRGTLTLYRGSRNYNHRKRVEQYLDDNLNRCRHNR